MRIRMGYYVQNLKQRPCKSGVEGWLRPNSDSTPQMRGETMKEILCALSACSSLPLTTGSSSARSSDTTALAASSRLRRPVGLTQSAPCSQGLRLLSVSKCGPSNTDRFQQHGRASRPCSSTSMCKAQYETTQPSRNLVLPPSPLPTSQPTCLPQLPLKGKS